MFFSKSYFISFLAALPAIQAMPTLVERNLQSGLWYSLECYSANVTVNGVFVDAANPAMSELHYDRYLTANTCKNTFDTVIAQFDMALGRCVSRAGLSLIGAEWWDNCVAQAAAGWYEIDPTDDSIIKSDAPYKSDHAEGRGYDKGQ